MSAIGAVLWIALLGSIFGLLFSVLERRGARGRRWPWQRPGFATDVGWWFLTPLVTRAISQATIVVTVVGGAFALGFAGDAQGLREALARPRGAIVGWPPWLQAAAALLAGDLVGYGIHRMFHGTRWWRFHAVHHSSTHLDWLSSVRVHPINDITVKVAQSSVLLLLGFPATVVAAYVPFLVLWALLLHAEVDWDFGPLRGVLASPAFHRWHHAADGGPPGCNFAGLFPAIDRAFGTYHLPRGRRPSRLGIDGDPVPAGLVAQLSWPFRRS